MHRYQVHTIESAPEASRPALTRLHEAMGRVPNLAATMAESPVLIQGFVGAFGNFHGGSFTGAQRQALLLVNAVLNRCGWAVAFHSTLALREGLSPDDVAALRERRAPADAGLAALTGLAAAILEQRGHVAPAALEAFVAAGFTAAQVLEIIAGLAVSVMANYAGNITQPVLEDAFAAQRWLLR